MSSSWVEENMRKERQTWGQGLQRGRLTSQKPAKRHSGLCLVNSISWSPILVPFLVVDFTAFKLIMQKAHEIYTSESHNFGSCALQYLLFSFWLHIFGREANVFELQDWNSSNLSNFCKLQHNSSSSSRREELCYSRCSTSKHWNDTCLLPCCSRNDKPISNILLQCSPEPSTVLQCCKDIWKFQVCSIMFPSVHIWLGDCSF